MSLLLKDLLKFREKGNKVKDWVEKKVPVVQQQSQWQSNPIMMQLGSLPPGSLIGLGSMLDNSLQQMYSNAAQWR